MPTPAESEALAAQARGRCVQYLIEGLGPLADALLEHAQSLLDKPVDRATQMARAELVRHMFTARVKWHHRLGKSLRQALDGGAGTLFGKALPLPDREGRSAPLTLVEDDTMEQELAASRLAMAMSEQNHWEFNDLRARLMVLEGTRDLDARDILQSSVQARMATEAWFAEGFTLAQWRDLQHVLHEQFGLLSAEAFHETNRWMLDQGVMTEVDLRPFIRRTAGEGASAGPATAPPPTAPGDPAAASRPKPTEPQSSYEAYVTRPVAIPGERLVARIQEQQAVIERLTGLMGAAQTDFAPTMRQPVVSPGLGQAIEAAQQGMAQWPTRGAGGAVTMPFLQREIEQQRRVLKEAAATPEERTTIEIVALLFQSILTEESLPSGMRVWFARLQMPVLRVAVTEPDFFATLDHPARRLIDRMGACVMGFGGGTQALDESVEQEIRRIVQVVEAYPDTGRRVFQSVLTEFEKFLETFFREKNEASRVGVSLAQQLEQRETLAIQYTIELRKMLESVPVQDEIRRFLFETWADVLATAGVGHGTSSEQTKAMKRVAADLIWSAGAKVTREERASVLRKLPSLLKSLREGMSTAGIDPSRQDELIKTLNDSLAAGFTARAAAIPQRQLSDLKEQLESLEEMIPDASLLEIDESLVRDIPGSNSAGLEVVRDGGDEPMPAMISLARELQVGAWFMLNHGGRHEPVQLAWHGLRKQLSLFVAASGQCKLFQQHRLAAYLQAGLIEPAQDEALTIKATREAIDILHADPQRLKARG